MGRNSILPLRILRITSNSEFGRDSSEALFLTKILSEEEIQPLVGSEHVYRGYLTTWRYTEVSQYSPRFTNENNARAAQIMRWFSPTDCKLDMVLISDSQFSHRISQLIGIQSAAGAELESESMKINIGHYSLLSFQKQ